jgi:peptide-methionine (S)-S-oxide reductase
MKTIYLGGGCFWCTEAVFKELRGVSEVMPGYMGGSVAEPSYEAVSSGSTGHAEVIKVVYDDAQITTEEILDVFFAVHDPTTPNRQGADVGTQYRSVIFYTDELMREKAMEAITRAQAAVAGKLITTHVGEAMDFYAAEGYHHNYYELHRDAPYCQVVIDPKIEKLHKQFNDKLKTGSQ